MQSMSFNWRETKVFCFLDRIHLHPDDLLGNSLCKQWCTLSSAQYSCKVRKDSADYIQRYSSFYKYSLLFVSRWRQEVPNLPPNFSETKQDIEKLKAPLNLVWKCCSVAIKIRSTIFPL